MSDEGPITRFIGGYRYLSNFYPAPVFMFGEVYPTVEHAYQAAKTEDPEIRRQIQACVLASDAKKITYKLVGAAPEGWDETRLAVMKELVRRKFLIEKFRSMLVATYPLELIEGNTWGDLFWGVDRNTGEGENHLGIILMNLREEIMEGLA